MTVTYHDSDLRTASRGKATEDVEMSDMAEGVSAACSYADLVWFERRYEWGTQRKMLKHRNGLFVAEVINDWR